jgi:GNAT superfamily N-acetyltransferase
MKIRPLLKEDIPGVARVHVDGWRSAYAGFMNPQYLASLNYDQTAGWLVTWIYDRPAPLFGYVVNNGQQIIGFSLAGLNTGEPIDYDGEIYKLFIDTTFQGRGLGLKLLQATVKEMRQQGFKRVELWSFKKSTSVNFYQKLGGKVVHELLESIGEDQLEVVIFGWEIGDLSTILKIL